MNCFDENGFISYMKADEKSRNTINKYVRDVRAFFGYTNGRHISKEEVIGWKKSLEAAGYRPASINSMLASVNAYLRYTGRGDCRVRNLRIQRQIFRPAEKELSREEYFRLVEASEGNRQLQLIIQTLGSTGARVSELKAFTVEDVRSGTVVINCKNKIRKIMIPDRLRCRLLEYASENGTSSGPVFCTSAGKNIDRTRVWHEMKALCESADIDPRKVYPHNLRRLFAREYYSIDKDISRLADMLGHSSTNTTRIYIMSSGREHRKQIERLGLV